MIRAIIEFLVSIWKAIFKLKDTISQENQQEAQQQQAEQQQQMQEVQQHLQDQYDKIDSQANVSGISTDSTIHEIGDKLNDRF